MIETSPTIKAISAALLKFQGAVDGVEKNKTNPGFKSRYANLEAVRDTAVPELQAVGIVYAQSPGSIVDGVMAMTTMLIHPESGEWMKFTGDIALGKRDPQGVGSAMTYMARYSLMAALGLPPVDDDGEAAMERQPANRRPTTSEPAIEAPQKTYTHYLNDITNAKNEAGLKAIFAELWRDASLSKGNKDTLKEAYEAKKAELTVPEGYQAPNFDDLPAETQQAAKNMSAG